MIKNKKIKVAVLLVLILTLSGCSAILDRIAVLRGDLIGNRFEISVYDHYANKTLELNGSKITVGLLENESNSSSESPGFESSVLEITINGREMIQVGNTVIFAEEGLDMVEDFQTPSNIDVSGGGGFVPLDRFVNDLRNNIGKDKTIIISSQMGIPIGVYQGERVFVTVPDDLPKMTRLNIDGKSLYIHRANYVILDTDLME